MMPRDVIRCCANVQNVLINSACIFELAFAKLCYGKHVTKVDFSCDLLAASLRGSAPHACLFHSGSMKKFPSEYMVLLAMRNESMAHTGASSFSSEDTYILPAHVSPQQVTQPTKREALGSFTWLNGASPPPTKICPPMNVTFFGFFCKCE